MRPLRSAEATKRLKGVGSTFYDILKESIAGQKGKKPFTVSPGKFSAIAPAALVALLELEEASASVASANGTSFPMEDLIRKINELIDPRANASLNQAAEKYLDPNNLDPGWGQIKKLAAANAAAELGGPFIKERKKKDACVSGRIYELLDSGRELARKLRDLARLGPAEPGPLRQLPDETVDEEFGNVTMSMDFRGKLSNALIKCAIYLQYGTNSCHLLLIVIGQRVEVAGKVFTKCAISWIFEEYLMVSQFIIIT